MSRYKLQETLDQRRPCRSPENSFFQTNTSTLFATSQECLFFILAGPYRCYQRSDICLSLVAAYSHWQLGNTNVIVVSCNTCDLHQTLSTSDEFWKALQQCCNANNSLARPERYTQKPWNLARVNAYLEERGENVSKGLNPEGLTVIKEHLVYRDCARRAFAQADNSEMLRREFLPQAKTSPSFSSHVYKTAPEYIRCLFLHDAQQSMEQ